MAKIFFCIDEQIEVIDGNRLLTAIILEGDCVLEPGENPNNSQVLQAREMITLAIKVAIEAVFGSPIHVSRAGESLIEGMAVARDKAENPFSTECEIELDTD